MIGRNMADDDRRGAGTGIGAGVGAAIGALIGREIDRNSPSCGLGPEEQPTQRREGSTSA
jgi:hypothetical protein